MPISLQFMGVSKNKGGVALAFPPANPNDSDFPVIRNGPGKFASQSGKPNA